MYYYTHRMLNLNRFKDSIQVLEKNPRLCFMRKKSSRIHKECSNNFFWPKIFTTNTLCANVYKMYDYDKNQVPYCNVKSFKKSYFWDFWAIDKTWPTLDQFYYSHFHK
jgi:hypothetical protein